MKTVNARIMHAALRLFAEKGAKHIAISDLAKEAGLSRGTIYNNIENPDDLFSVVCELVYLEQRQTTRTEDSDITDPALRLALILRKVIRRVYEEPDWGKFIAQFGMIDPRLGKFWGKLPNRLLREGLASGRFQFREDQIHSITALSGGAVMGATALVLGGLQTWRKSGSDTSELVLRALGIDPAEARVLSNKAFDPMPRLDFSQVELKGTSQEFILG